MYGSSKNRLASGENFESGNFPDLRAEADSLISILENFHASYMMSNASNLISNKNIQFKLYLLINVKNAYTKQFGKLFALEPKKNHAEDFITVCLMRETHQLNKLLTLLTPGSQEHAYFFEHFQTVQGYIN